VLTGTATITIESPILHLYDPNGADRDVVLPAFARGLYFAVGNVGTGFLLNVKTSGGTLVGPVEPNGLMILYCGGNEWLQVGRVFGPSGPNHSIGLVPDPGSSVGSTRFLREDGQWSTPGPIGFADAYQHVTDGTNTANAVGADTFKLRSANGILTILVTDNQPTHGDNALFTVDQTQIDHNALLNFVANKHIDHSTVTLTAGNGLSGGGDITASRTFDLDLNDLTTDTPVLGDTIAFFDVSGSDTNKCTITTLNGIIDHNALLNFVANKHIDHSLVSINAGNGLSGGGDITVSRTIDLDLNDLTTDTPVLGDSIAFFDVSGSDTNKCTITTLNGILDHNALVNFVANKHIDHSTVNITAGRGMSGGGDITVSRTLDVTFTVNAQTGTTYTYLNSDGGKLVTHTNASAIAGTLPQAGSGGNFASGWFMAVQNRGAGTLTITPTTSTIDGAANLVLTTGQGAWIFSDGTNYFTERGMGSGGSSGNMTRRTITGADTIVAGDKGNIVEATSGSFTLAFTAAATLANGFWCIIYNSGTGDVTLDPNSTEQIDGLTSWVLYPGGSIIVSCTGSAFESVLISGMRKQFDSSGTLTKPGVGTICRLQGWGGGASGARGRAAATARGSGGGGGGAFNERILALSALGATETVTIGAGGAAQTTDSTAGNVGGNTTIGSLLTAFGGGGGGPASAGNTGPGGGGGGALNAGSTGVAGQVGADGGTLISASFTADSGGVPFVYTLSHGKGGDNTNGTGDGHDNTDGGGGGGSSTVPSPGGKSIRGGGGGGGGNSGAGAGAAGGASEWGGGGGGGGTVSGTGGAGGVSQFGGNGGAGTNGANAGNAGTQPGGGGGGSQNANSGAGAAGRAIAYIW